MAPRAIGVLERVEDLLLIGGSDAPPGDVDVDAQLVATCKLNPDNTVTVTGTEKISMKDFSIDPPTFMLGTIKTGNDITLSFNLTLKRS